MSRDYVTIANMASGFFGEDDQIRSPDEDSKPARAIAAVWDNVRKFVLAAGEWNFATRRLALSPRPATTQNPIIGFSHAYPLPTDFRRFIEILEPRALRAAYALEADAAGKSEILVDHPGPLFIRYVRDVEDPALWSDGFAEAFAMRLAWQIADRLGGDKQRKQQALVAYKDALSSAKGTDAKQNPPREHVAGEWVRARCDGRSDLRSGHH